ncbi:MAG: hypothetical protein ACRDHD_00180 [Candidatus Limnocylindria bacterium]
MRALPRLAGLLVLAGCLTAAPSPAADGSHAGHDPQAERVKAALGEGFGMTFEPAGPHHELGRAEDGVELDLVGVPVEQVVLSLPSDQVAVGLGYLPHLRDLLHGPDVVYDRAAAMLACRELAERTCDERFAQGNVEARVTEAAGFVVLTLTRG